MNYKYRVTLEGIKGFYRLYTISGQNSLYTFHKQLRSDLEFPVDQPILFKAFDAEGNVVARYALFDLGSGSVDQITIDASIKNGIVKFVYFYDTASKKSVNISFEGECEISTSLPMVFDTKGPLPIDFENGYVAFEDLPDEKRRLPGEHSADKENEGFDDDDDDDENGDFDDEDGEDEEKEEEEIIYSDNE